MAKQDQAYWEKLIAGAVRVKHPDDISQIARLAVDRQDRGENASAWHASAEFYGYLHRCNCVPCANARKAA